jgi:biotin operon repressor
MINNKCINCNEEKIAKDIIALNRKLISRKTKQFLCLKCLSHYLSVSEEILIDKIKQYKEEGCDLFI